MNIIQTWKEEGVPPICYNFIQNMRGLNKNCNHALFIDDDIIHFIKSKFPEYFETFVQFKYKIQQIDFFRYLVIYYYGGVYLDIDMKMEMPFDDLDLNKCVFPIEYIDKNNSNEIGLIGNYAFYSPRQHPFIKHIIDSIVNPPISDSEIKFAQDNHTDDREHVYVYYTTGPELVTRAYWNYPERESVRLLSTEPFQKDCFGKYGRHCSYGSWKHPNSDQNPIGEPMVPL